MGTTTVIGGTGAFENASGIGTFESFARFGTFYGAAYEQVVVSRLQFTVPDGAPQLDTRDVSVSVRVGIDDQNTGHGVNVGVPTSDSSNYPLLTNLRAEYEVGVLPSSGVSENSNAAGDAQRWTYQSHTGVPVFKENMPSFFYYSAGDATLAEGAGFYEGFTGSGTWESFSVGLGPITDNVWSHSNVVIDRYSLAPIPEPETYAMVLIGLAGVGFAMRRRLS